MIECEEINSGREFQDKYLLDGRLQISAAARCRRGRRVVFVGGRKHGERLINYDRRLTYDA